MHILEDDQNVDSLILGYLNAELSPNETNELITWIKNGEKNKKYFDECCEIWITARASGNNSGYYAQKGFYTFKQKIKAFNRDDHAENFKIRLLRTIARYAAIIVITFSLTGNLFYFIGKHSSIQHNQSYNELVVPMGSRAQFLLSDGTVVNLNAGSRLKYNGKYGINDRIVELEGEAYFKVAENAAKPFIVKTLFLNVIALGTEFNVKAYSTDETVETTLVKGSIKIESVEKDEEITVLEPNQKLTFYKEESRMVDETKDENTNINAPATNLQSPTEVPKVVTETVNVEPVVSWKEDRWIFVQQSLAQIAVELERRFDVQINIESERLKAFRFTGTIIEEPIEEVLEVMSITAPINFNLKGRVITLSENKNFEELNKNLYNRRN